jgi:hypothetical protein
MQGLKKIFLKFYMDVSHHVFDRRMMKHLFRWS